MIRPEQHIGSFSAISWMYVSEHGCVRTDYFRLLWLLPIYLIYRQVHVHFVYNRTAGFCLYIRHQNVKQPFIGYSFYSLIQRLTKCIAQVWRNLAEYYIHLCNGDLIRHVLDHVCAMLESAPVSVIRFLLQSYSESTSLTSEPLLSWPVMILPEIFQGKTPRTISANASLIASIVGWG